MAAHSPTIRQLSSSHAARARWGKPTEDSARDLAAARAEDYIKRLASEMPPLTTEQRNKLAVLLLAPGTAP